MGSLGPHGQPLREQTSAGCGGKATEGTECLQVVGLSVSRLGSWQGELRKVEEGKVGSMAQKNGHRACGSPAASGSGL